VSVLLRKKLLPVRRSLIRNSVTSEAKVIVPIIVVVVMGCGGRGLERGLCPHPRKKLYKGSVVRVSASYRPSSKVVGCEGGIWGGACVPSPGKKYFYIPVQ